MRNNFKKILWAVLIILTGSIIFETTAYAYTSPKIYTTAKTWASLGEPTRAWWPGSNWGNVTSDNFFFGWTGYNLNEEFGIDGLTSEEAELRYQQIIANHPTLGSMQNSSFHPDWQRYTSQWYAGQKPLASREEDKPSNSLAAIHASGMKSFAFCYVPGSYKGTMHLRGICAEAVPLLEGQDTVPVVKNFNLNTSPRTDWVTSSNTWARVDANQGENWRIIGFEYYFTDNENDNTLSKLSNTFSIRSEITHFGMNDPSISHNFSPLSTYMSPTNPDRIAPKNKSTTYPANRDPYYCIDGLVFRGLFKSYTVKYYKNTPHYNMNTNTVSYSPDYISGQDQRNPYNRDNAYPINSNNIIASPPIGYKFNGWKDNKGKTTDDNNFSYVSKNANGQWVGKDYSTASLLQKFSTLTPQNYKQVGSEYVIELSAQWEANKYKVNYCGNKSSYKSYTGSSAVYYNDASVGDGLTGSYSQDFKYDNAQNLSENQFTRKGYYFTGWNSKPDGSGTHYDAGQSVYNLTSVDNGEVNLYAEWEPIPYFVDYDGNGYTSGYTNSQEFMFDNDGNGALRYNGFRKIGYKFVDWCTEPDGSGAHYAAGEVLRDNLVEDPQWDSVNKRGTSHVKLYAQWEPIHYKVRFDANGDNVIGHMSDEVFTYDVQQALSGNEYKRAGYTFYGWNTDALGDGVNYADKQDVINLTDTDGGIIVLYAVWKQDEYTVKFVDPIDDETIAEDSVPYHGSATAPVPREHEGKVFTGWDKKFDDIIEDTVVTAQYRDIKGRVRFDANGGTGNMDDVILSYFDSFTVPGCLFKHDGYVFTGWNLSADNDSTAYNVNEIINKGFISKDGDSITLYAQWRKIDDNLLSYLVYPYDSGNSVSQSRSIVQYNTPSDICVAIEKKGWRFIGWCDASQGNIRDIYNNMKNNNVVLNTQAALETNQIICEDKSITVTPLENGWVDGEYIAMFVQDTVKVTFTDGQGTTLSEQVIPYGSDAVSPVLPKREGYKFSGWDKGYTKVTSDIIVNATWVTTKDPTADSSTHKENKVTITYTDGNGTILKKEEVPYGGNGNPPAVPPREGYRFNGWDTDYTNVTKNITVNATWEATTLEKTITPGNNTTTTPTQSSLRQSANTTPTPSNNNNNNNNNANNNDNNANNNDDNNDKILAKTGDSVISIMLLIMSMSAATILLIRKKKTNQ